MKDFYEDLHCELYKTRPSLKFWYLIIILSMVIIGCIHLHTLIFLLLGVSVAAFFISFGGIFQERGKKLWVLFTPYGWGMMVVAGVVWLFNNTIIRFNEWLDKDYEY